jgi:hypothetical protein
MVDPSTTLEHSAIPFIAASRMTAELCGVFGILCSRERLPDHKQHRAPF